MLDNQRLGMTLVGVFLTTTLSLTPVPASAQWRNAPDTVPKTKDGKPNFGAPAPRKPYGKPDLSGIWSGDEQNSKYVDLAADFKPGEFPIQPWAEALSRERIVGGLAWPPAHCLPASIPVLDGISTLFPLKIIQEPGLLVFLYEYLGEIRQVFVDGRAAVKNADPTWLGYSVAKWEGDVLVVDSTGFNGKIWLDVRGHPATDALHITERFRRRDFGHLDLQVTIDDPKAYVKPWTVTMPMHLSPETELMEFVCNENEADVKHMVNK